jgi:glutathione S-transferase
VTLQLFDLTCANQRIFFSPYCWRTRMALAHKGLQFESLPWHFVEKDRIAPSGGGRVPVLVENGRQIADSWTIARHLDETYPDTPPLMADAAARSRARFIETWCALSLFARLIPLAVPAVFEIIAEKDKAYFRESREARFGCRIEEISTDFEAERDALHKALKPAADALGEAPYLAGDAPDYADYVLFGTLMWPYAISKGDVIDMADPVGMWFARLLDAHDGFARKAARAAD